MRIFGLGTTELIIILVIILLVFGVGRISKISGELGKSIREFRKGVTDVSQEENEPPTGEEEKK